MKIIKKMITSVKKYFYIKKIKKQERKRKYVY